MGGPLDRSTLHRRLGAEQGPAGGHNPLEAELDSLLGQQHRCRETAQDAADRRCPDKSPLDRLRDVFRVELGPLVDRIAERYRAKNIHVHMDTSAFLEGGRTIVIDIAFGGYRVVREGTMMPDSIAFTEIHYFPDAGETVSAGATLRAKHLTQEGFADFIFKAIIALVRTANRSAGR